MLLSKSSKFFLFLIFFFFACCSPAQSESFTLIYQDDDKNLDPEIKEGIIEIFDSVYPKLVDEFNPKALKEVAIKIDTVYDGVAYAYNGQIVINADWLRSKPKDLDLVTHELMHVVQAYPNNAGPGWLTEGIADYVRHVYGLDNESGGWSLTPFNESQNYTNSYRITARFLVWASQNYKDDLVTRLDENLRNGTYTIDLWKNYTGKSLDRLWKIYSKNPELNRNE